jgi:hypothetical protein
VKTLQKLVFALYLWDFCKKFRENENSRAKIGKDIFVSTLVRASLAGFQKVLANSKAFGVKQLRSSHIKIELKAKLKKL